MSVMIKQINDAQGAADFLQFGKMARASDPLHTADPTSLPSEGVSWLAYRDSQVAARCSARLQSGGTGIGTIGNFEAHDDQAACKVLLQAATEWLRQSGATRVVGPMDGDTWHHYRFNVGPFEAAPFLKEPWNPAYYPALWLAAGFTVTESYVTYRVDDPASAADNQRRFFQRCQKNGYTFTPITARNYDAMLPLIHDLSCQIFNENKLYTPLDQAAFIEMYRPAKPLLRKGLVWLAFSPDGTPTGYIFAYPDYAAAMLAMRGKRNLTAKIRFLMSRSKATRLCIKTLGVLPAQRRSGLSAALTHLVYQHGAALGYNQALMCLMHSANDSTRFGGNVAEPFRSYALYEAQP